MRKATYDLNQVEKHIQELQKPIVVLPVGIPGSGKTTLMKKLSSSLGLEYISPDDIRERLTGDVANQHENKKVWKKSYEKGKKLLSKQQSFVVDATHVDKHRTKGVELYKDHGAASVVAVVFDTPLSVAKARNGSRKHVVPNNVLERMQKTLKNNPPTHDEGFTDILIFKEKS